MTNDEAKRTMDCIAGLLRDSDQMEMADLHEYLYRVVEVNLYLLDLVSRSQSNVARPAPR